MSNTVKSLIDKEIGRFAPSAQSTLADANVRKEVISALNKSDDLDSDSLDLDSQIAEENIRGIRNIIRSVVEDVASHSRLMSIS